MALFHESSSRGRGPILSVVLAIFFVLAYLFLFPRGLGKELFIVPVKVSALVETNSALTPGGSFFRLGSWEGYWGPDGGLERARPARENLQVTPKKIAFYNADQDQVEVEGQQGPLLKLKGVRYPYWVGDRLYLFEENRLGLSEITPDGNTAWSRRFASLITAIDAGKTLTVVGTLDGKVQMIGPDGSLKGAFSPGGSRLPVIYNTSLSTDEKRVLILAGVDPKRFEVLEKASNDFRPIFHKPLEDTTPKPTPLGFLSGGRLAYYETAAGLVLLDTLNTSRETLFPTKAAIQDLNYLPDRRLLAVLETQASSVSLNVFSLEGAEVLHSTFGAENVLLQPQGSTYILGIDQNLLVLELRQE